MPKGKKGFDKGDPNINTTGLNKGSKKEKSFVDFYDEIAQEIAVKNGLTEDEVKKVIYKVGYAKAKEGNYQFYKDVLDRIHGQATAKSEQITKIEIDVKDVEKINKAIDEVL